jgi:hypothetical protein
VLDPTGYPSVQCEGTLDLEIPEHAPVHIVFHAGQPAVGSLSGIALPRAGVFRLNARFGALCSYSNPTLCTTEDMPGLFWGDPHVHTDLSNCIPGKCRSIYFCYIAARQLSGMDWVTAADHVSNARCNRGVFKEQRTVSDLYDDPPAFATLPGYEASLHGGCGGDANVYMARFPEMFVDEYDNGNLKTLAVKLEELLPDAFFLVPHHTTRTGKHGEIPQAIYPGPKAMPLVEIHSKWGTSEYRGNPNALLQIHPGPSYAADLLAQGFRFGFIAGTDSHATMPSGGGDEPEHINRLPGLTAVRCATLSRASIFDAMRQRHCYAASRERIILHGTIAGCAFGDETPARPDKGPVAIALLAAAQSDITRLDVVKNGQTIHSETPNAWMTRIAYEDTTPAPTAGTADYYYVRITCQSGAQAWSSPVWVGG